MRLHGRVCEKRYQHRRWPQLLYFVLKWNERSAESIQFRFSSLLALLCFSIYVYKRCSNSSSRSSNNKMYFMLITLCLVYCMRARPVYCLLHDITCTNKRPKLRVTAPGHSSFAIQTHTQPDAQCECLYIYALIVRRHDWCTERDGKSMEQRKLSEHWISGWGV